MALSSNDPTMSNYLKQVFRLERIGNTTHYTMWAIRREKGLDTARVLDPVTSSSEKKRNPSKATMMPMQAGNCKTCLLWRVSARFVLQGIPGRLVLNQPTSLWRAQRVAGPWRVLQLGLLVGSCSSKSYKESACLTGAPLLTPLTNPGNVYDLHEVINKIRTKLSKMDKTRGNNVDKSGLYRSRPEAQCLWRQALTAYAAVKAHLPNLLLEEPCSHVWAKTPTSRTFEAHANECHFLGIAKDKKVFKFQPLTALHLQH